MKEIYAGQDIMTRYDELLQNGTGWNITAVTP